MRTARTLRRVASVALLSVLSSAGGSCAPAADGSEELALTSQEQALPIRGDGDGDGDGVSDPDHPGRPPVKPPPPPTPRPSFVELMGSFTNYDMNGDGRIEINSLKPAFVNPEPYSAQPKGVVIVFVDPRLVRDDPSTNISSSTMRGTLYSYGYDLVRDGYFPYFVEADVYNGTAHQDGRTLLAMRRFLRQVRNHYPLAGTVLVGSFPDAAIVRTTMVRNHQDKVTFTNNSLLYRNVDTLDVTSEFVTPRGEIVLGDLDGNWENVYRESTFTYRGASLLPPTTAFPFAGQVMETADFTPQVETYSDVFFVDDAQVTITQVHDAIALKAGADQPFNGRVRLTVHSVEEKNPEIGPNDSSMYNRMARPEILVSRINTRHVAIMPTVDRPDLDGKTSPIGPDGKPQTLRYGTSMGPQVIWVRSAQLERRLLVDYFARSHRFRRGEDNGKPFRTSAIRQADSGLRSPDSFNTLLRGAASGFSTSYVQDNASMLDYIDWLKQPAVLRGIASHSTETQSLFAPSVDLGAMENAIGGKPWRWESTLNWTPGMQWVLTPSLGNGNIGASFSLHRTMWENGALAGAGQFFTIHDGCEVNVPPHARNVPYNDPTYGQANDFGSVQNGESLLFYANGLALMARNKVFNDTPEGFVEAVKSTGEFGRGWAGYFFRDAAQSSLDERSQPYGVARRTITLQRKRAYFWNVIGDGTLKLRYP